MQVAIRPLQESDAYTSYKWRNDDEVFKFTGRGGVFANHHPRVRIGLAEESTNQSGRVPLCHSCGW